MLGLLLPHHFLRADKGSVIDSEVSIIGRGSVIDSDD